MTYKVNLISIDKISSPITVYFDGQVKKFKSGGDMVDFEFDNNYVIDNISCENEKILIILKANDKINETSWFNGKQITFE